MSEFSIAEYSSKILEELHRLREGIGSHTTFSETDLKNCLEMVRRTHTDTLQLQLSLEIDGIQKIPFDTNNIEASCLRYLDPSGFRIEHYTIFPGGANAELQMASTSASLTMTLDLTRDVPLVVGLESVPRNPTFVANLLIPDRWLPQVLARLLRHMRLARLLKQSSSRPSATQPKPAQQTQQQARSSHHASG
ncbi:hypothetical protein PAPYR_8400 [Paratrimastix pyriformis]|uniref:DUF1997 domain-containing protein n=1 Tax=Paratrimastix pyriformis TaxID=342808 RepID=A0ABQ8UES7_9EUKA|nr:hypothetical protein PAPYR_8400 [Paratrimastix pyriformis]